MSHAVKLFCVLFCALAKTSGHEKRPSDDLPVLPGFWNDVLWRASNYSGQMERDRVMEKLFSQLFNDFVVPSLEQEEELMGMEMDPMWMWPVSERIHKSGFEADFSACDIHVHNFRSVKLLDVKVFRNSETDALALRILFRFPILWMTGYYKLLGSLLFGFIPVKNRRGDFNIDINDISVVIITTIKTFDTDNDSDDLSSSNNNNNSMNFNVPNVPKILIDEFKIGVSWKNVEMNFEKIAGRFSTLAHLTLNELGLGTVVINKQKGQILAKVRDYFQALFECYLTKPASGVDLCMRSFWEIRGWPWPWKYPECEKVYNT